MRSLSRSSVVIFSLAWFTISSSGRDAYQQYQADKAHDAWRERAFFDNISRGASPPPVVFQSRTPKGGSDGIDPAVQQRYREESRAWNLKLDRQAREERQALYQEIRTRAGGRMPLTEPPALATAAAWVDWILRQADLVPNDPYVAWCAALIALDEVRPELTAKQARAWLTHANQEWPETKALLGRLLLLGEGGPKDEALGWSLLLAAEPQLRDLKQQQRGRSHLYYALGRGYAERGDDVAALSAFDHNVEGSTFIYSTWAYVRQVFWPERASHAAELVVRAEASDRVWSWSPRDWLRSASRETLSPALTPDARASLLELKRQYFLLQLAEQDRAGRGMWTARAQVESLIEDGVPGAAAEFLLPDTNGHFFRAESPAEKEKWYRESSPALDRLVQSQEPRALAAMVARSLWPETGAPDITAAEAWAERGLAVGDPWGAVYVGVFHAPELSAPLVSGAMQRADRWLDRAEKAPHAAQAYEGVYWYLREHGFSSLSSPRPQAWLQLGRVAGNARAAALSATDHLINLTNDPARLNADRLVWAKAEQALTEALAAARTEKDRRFLRAELSTLNRRQVEARRGEDRLAQNERAIEAELDALVAAEKPRLETSLHDALAEFTGRMTGGALTGQWSYAESNGVGSNGNEFREKAHQLRFRRDPVAVLLAAVFYAKSANEGNLLDIFEALEAVERAAPASPLLKQWRAEIALALGARAERGDAQAALRLAEKGGPDGAFAESAAADLHAARWYRRAAELGEPQSLFKLRQHFEDKEPVNALYRRLSQFFSAHGDDMPKELNVISAALLELPSSSQEAEAIEAYWDAREARRQRSQAQVVKELPEAWRVMDRALAQLESEATKPGSPGKSFFNSDPTDDFTDADNELERDVPTLETEIVIMARHIGAAVSGDFYMACSMPGEWFDALPEQGRRWNTAMAAILSRDARLGSLSALNRLCGLYSPTKNSRTDATRWEKNFDQWIVWCRAAIEAGEWGQLDAIVAAYASQPDRLAQYQGWKEFQVAAETLKGAPRAERIAFARAHLPAASQP